MSIVAAFDGEDVGFAWAAGTTGAAEAAGVAVGVESSIEDPQAEITATIETLINKNLTTHSGLVFQRLYIACLGMS